MAGPANRELPRIWIALAIVVIVGVAFASWGGGLGPQPQWVRLVRTECYGTCPAYDVTLYPDGRVIFVGIAYVDKKGRHEKRIAPEQFEHVWKKIHEVGFWSMKDRYTASVTDLPHKVVTVRTQMNEKSVDDYHGAPRELGKLERFIDEIAGTSDWIGSGEKIYGNP